MKHHTKDKGDLGVLKAQVDLYQQGFLVAMPLTEHAPFDLIIYKESRFLRVQVKFRALDKNGTLQVKLSTCWTDKNGIHTTPIPKEEVDLICVYCPDTDSCYYFDPKNWNGAVTLRVRASKNNQKMGVHLASEYRWVP